MYKIKVESDFSSAHNLRGYRGKCEELHGHNWKVEVLLCASRLDKSGMLEDFKVLKMQLNRILDTLDHKYLNDIAYFSKVNPTSENIAKYIFDRLKTQNPKLKAVTVWESDDSCATYEPRSS
jgi:6-pyruvoyltetrahydropterin/6-carboxytetrahydropterin synthase